MATSSNTAAAAHPAPCAWEPPPPPPGAAAAQPAASAWEPPPSWSCAECSTQVTPVKRSGPKGSGTLCNACGLRMRKQSRSIAGQRKPPKTKKRVRENDETRAKKVRVGIVDNAKVACVVDARIGDGQIGLSGDVGEVGGRMNCGEGVMGGFCGAVSSGIPRSVSSPGALTTVPTGISSSGNGMPRSVSSPEEIWRMGSDTGMNMIDASALEEGCMQALEDLRRMNTEMSEKMYGIEHEIAVCVKRKEELTVEREKVLGDIKELLGIKDVVRGKQRLVWENMAQMRGLMELLER